uniref:Uncharacterized protein n=1 Tax=Eunotia naegelii TaxID=1458866 RepID=A0A023JEE1_9STRA|nr:hypothetical protein [Eunotia naegelii]AHI51135.1 hypothetical protein [Eunotia naegelii]
MNFNFNKQKFLELIKEYKTLSLKGKYLFDFDKVKNDELTIYLTFLDDNTAYLSKKKYFQIIESFINQKITVNEFIYQYSELRRSNFNQSEMLQKNLEAEALSGLIQESKIDLQLNPKCEGFTDILSYIDNDIDLFDENISFEMNLNNLELIGYGLSEEFFRQNMQDNFMLLIGKYCNIK